MTVFVISVAVIGIVRLQAFGFFQISTAGHRSQAAIAAQSMSERLHASSAAAEEGLYDGINHPSAQAPRPTGCVEGDTCSAARAVSVTTWEWDHALGQSLPSGRGQIDCVESTAGQCRTYRVRVFWSMNGEQVTSGDCGQSFSRKDCYQLWVTP